ncbi:hypothetical protein J4Q44_G00043870 [Coregonus suidteri]|uniref:Uncharacterized protein n=1 Tax=Coregonus suidteri TaxID=861788 RepID=A0AAN8MJ73_9TELE
MMDANTTMRLQWCGPVSNNFLPATEMRAELSKITSGCKTTSLDIFHVYIAQLHSSGIPTITAASATSTMSISKWIYGFCHALRSLPYPFPRPGSNLCPP